MPYNTLEKKRQWKRRNPHKLRQQARRYRYKKGSGMLRGVHLKHKYGVTEEWYRQKFAEQGGVCAICGNPEVAKNSVGGIRYLAVDHCHATGKNRDLLCMACNTLLGRAGDTIQRLEGAIAYLRRHNTP